ncbi:MAG: AI-2E family transporter [Firmicutes bacterium]|nr:AI-2E family transporter [Bacillota bacterium]
MAKRYNEKKNWTKWVYWFTFAVAVIVVYKTLDNFGDISLWFKGLMSVLMPFILGILLAYILYIPCRFYENLYKKVKILDRPARGMSIATVYLIVLLLIILLINIIIPAASKGITDLANNLPTYYNNAMGYVDNIPDNSLIKKEKVQEIIEGLRAIDITKVLSLDNVTSYVTRAMGLANAILGIFVTIVISIYILMERKAIIKFLSKLGRGLFKENVNKFFGKYFIKSNTIFFKFLLGQMLDAVVVGTIVSIAMLIMGVKYAVLLGVMVGLFNLIPYFGPIVGILIAAVITLFTGGFSQALWLLFVTIVLQQLDANIINPKIVGTALKLSPILIIFAVIVAGAYFGILGMFLAVPIAAIIKILVLDFLDYRIEKKQEIEA